MIFFCPSYSVYLNEKKKKSKTESVNIRVIPKQYLFISR